MDNAEQLNETQTEPSASLRLQLGEKLKAARLSQNKEVSEVARMLMLSKLQLAAVEAGQSEIFHHELRYLQAIKSYVFYLNLDNNPPVKELCQQVESWFAAGLNASPAAGVAQLHLSSAAPAMDRVYVARRPKILYYGLGLVVAVAVGLAISEGWPFKDEMSETATAPAAQIGSLQGADKSTTTSNVNASGLAVVSADTAKPLTPSPQTASSPVTVAPVTVPPVNIATAGINALSTGQPASSSTPAPVASAAVKPADPPAGGPGRLRIDFSGDCWVSLQNIEGRKEERIYKQGQHLDVPVASVALMVLGNAPAAKVTLDSRAVDISGRDFTQGNVTRLDQKSLSALLKN